MSIDLKYTAQIERPIEVVCAAVSDLNQMSKWFSVKEVRNISEGPLEVGKKFQVVTEFMGSDQVIDYQVTDYEPCKKFIYSSDGAYPTEVKMLLEAVDGGTALTFEFSVKVSRMLAPMIKKPLRRQTRSDLERLVEMLQEG